MYGYVRPVKSELKLREYELFRAAYCGLCEALKQRCGPLARFVVNYDMTFLAMLLAEPEGTLQRKRCPAHPFRRRYCVCASPSLDAAADYSMILAWWKLKDDVLDKPFIPSIPARLGMLFLKKAYRKASRRCAAFDVCVRDGLDRLAVLEKAKSASLDETADTFASMLSSAGDTDGARGRVLREVLYHTGRLVYLLDAADDLEKDFQTGSYNPLLYRYDVKDGKMTDEHREELRCTMNLSQHRASAALQLMDKTRWTPIVENIVFLGIPAATEQVLSGKWKKKDKRKEIIPL